MSVQVFKLFYLINADDFCIDYVEAKAPGKEEAATAAKQVADAIVAEWFKPEVHGLIVS